MIIQTAERKLFFVSAKDVYIFQSIWEEDIMLMIVGGHSGDEAIMAGPIAAKVIREGGACVFVGATNGDGGHPILNRSQYAVQKDKEAREAAEIIGAECELWDISSGQLEVRAENVQHLATLIRRYQPDTVITHWRNSMHTDHVAAYYITTKAIRLAANQSFEDGQDVFKVRELYFGDNWEDADGFVPDVYVSILPEDEEKWLMACNCFEFFRGSFYNFNYRGYYEALHRMRGALAARKADVGHSGLAVGLMKAPKTAYDFTSWEDR